MRKKKVSKESRRGTLVEIDSIRDQLSCIRFPLPLTRNILTNFYVVRLNGNPHPEINQILVNL